MSCPKRFEHQSFWVLLFKGCCLKYFQVVFSQFNIASVIVAFIENCKTTQNMITTYKTHFKVTHNLCKCWTQWEIRKSLTVKHNTSNYEHLQIYFETNHLPIYGCSFWTAFFDIQDLSQSFCNKEEPHKLLKAPLRRSPWTIFVQKLALHMQHKICLVHSLNNKLSSRISQWTNYNSPPETVTKASKVWNFTSMLRCNRLINLSKQ